MYAITRTMLSNVEKRFEKLGMHLAVSEETARHLARTGHNDAFGARPLRRTVRRTIEDAAAELMLDGRLKRGGTVSAALTNGEVHLNVAD